MSENSSVYDELRLVRQLCDAVIRVYNTEFHVHKLVLCNCSPYFRTLFTLWSNPDDRDFDLSCVSPDMMRLIIDFAYTGIVPVTPENVRELFIAADRFDILGIVEACGHLLEEQLTPQNCINTWWFTDLYYNPQLKHKAFLYILNHFEEIDTTSVEFLQLSEMEITKIIENDQLNVRKEEMVFEAILQWINYTPEQRSAYISQLLPKVKLALMNPEYIMENVANNEMVKVNEECRQILLSTMDAMIDIRARRFSNSISFHPLACPRLPSAILLAIGGWSGGDSTNAVEAYDVRANVWVNLIDAVGLPRAYHGTAVLNGSLYCIGGFDGIEQYNTTLRFYLDTHTWDEVAPMYYRRCHISVTVLDGHIYAMGGYNGYSRLETAERYQPSNNQWTLIASMNEQRSDACCTTLHGKVYICGGFNGSSYLSTAECYNPQSNQWTQIAPMTTRRSGVGVVAYKDHIFAVGGFNGVNCLRTAEAYNPNTDTWYHIQQMHNYRSNFGIAVFDDCLFVVGGFNGLSTTPYVESYNAETGEWSEVLDMEISRSAVSCCVLSGLDNMAEYTATRYSLQCLDVEDDVD